MLIVPFDIFSMKIVENVDEPTVIFVDTLQTTVDGWIGQLDDMQFRNTVNISLLLFFFVVYFHL